ncbi:MAG: bifunctional DNA-formamidopyrimidine glycosylase/DNA-(apurinic or apyrimidinic site) lyase [Candidatus Omnitrophica bacterium]|nr:bifunctional DNA-formamidopyrimidine glycosylase/DNA-(apurinic or apyrimidinic site) lyase [Candidatus Omnitrophota bacterium]
MPELPEVETIKSDLEKVILNQTIIKVDVFRSSVVKQPEINKFKAGLKNARIRQIIRRGKLLVIELETKDKKTLYLTVHLRMTGQLVYGTFDKKARVSFKLSNGGYLCYNDQRTLGELRLVKDWQQLSVVAKMGPEPLSKEFKLNGFSQQLSRRLTKIKPLLLDQHFIAGIGNIYAAEALFLSKIMPDRQACSLTKAEVCLLFKNIKQVLKKAIKCRGSSFSDYRDGHGQLGNFSQHFYVYGRKAQPCLVCKNKIQRIVLGGRGTFFCSKCQK